MCFLSSKTEEEKCFDIVTTCDDLTGKCTNIVCNNDVEQDEQGEQLEQPRCKEVFWLECEIREKDGEEVEVCVEGEEVIPPYQSILPYGVIITFQILAFIFELHVILIYATPMFALVMSFILLDYIIDWLWWLIFGFYCEVCAYVFIWIFNIIFLPFTLIGWTYRLQIESIGFLFDGWMLFFNGEGCYLRWGRYCWLARRMVDRYDWTYMDLVAFSANPQNMLNDFVPESFDAPGMQGLSLETFFGKVGAMRRNMMRYSVSPSNGLASFAKDFIIDTLPFVF